jgi:hypothetical protein
MAHRVCATIWLKSAPGSDIFDAFRNNVEHDLNLLAKQIGSRRSAAAILHLFELDAGYHLEELAGDVAWAPGAGRAKIELARIGLGVGDEFRNCLGWKSQIDHHDQGGLGNARDRRDVANEIEIELS